MPKTPTHDERHVTLELGDFVVHGIEVADTTWRRLRGMLARRPLPQGLLLVPGGSVHGIGMTVSLDVALLAPLEPVPRHRKPNVLGAHRVVRSTVLRPFGLVPSARGVRTVLEAPVGSFARWGLAEGRTVIIHAGTPVQVSAQ